MQTAELGKNLLACRRQAGLTQQALAQLLGVSKAAISKWETGKAFPDITLLPRIADCFDVSIDALFGYAPQLTKAEIRLQYRRLASAFTKRPFANVYSECEALLAKYSTCYPFLLQIAVLYLNHAQLSPRPHDLLERCIQLCRTVKQKSDSVQLVTQAEELEACAQLADRNPQAVLDLLGNAFCLIPQTNELQAQALLMEGNQEPARRILQAGMYQHLLLLAQDATLLLGLEETPARHREIIRRILALSDVFELDRLHPNTMAVFYLTAAQLACRQRQDADALDYLERYAKLCLHDFFPLALQGDSFFDQIDSFFEEFDLGTDPPRDEAAVRQSLLQEFCSPDFEPLKTNARYKEMRNQLELAFGGNQDGTSDGVPSFSDPDPAH